MPATRSSGKRGVLRLSSAAAMTTLLAVGMAVAPSSPAWAATAITSITPASGPLAGGGTLVIIGTQLDNATVSVGPKPCGIDVNTSTRIECVLSDGTAGAKNVVVSADGGVDFRAGGYTYVAAPAITSVAPLTGPIAGGTTVTITGTDLGNASDVTVGSGSCAIGDPTTNTATKIVCVTSAGSTGPATISVTTPGGDDTDTNGLFSYVNPPTITELADANGVVIGGPQVGGTPLIINGTDLEGVTAITVGGDPCTGITANTGTSVTCTLPAGTPGDQTISLTNPGGTNTSFTYKYIATPTITSISPTEGPLNDGDPITITGTNLDGITSLKVDGLDCESISGNSSTEVTCAVPDGSAGAKTIALTNPGGTATKSSAYTYVEAPQISSVSPDSGPTQGLNVITINGTHLADATSVFVDGVPCTVDPATNTSTKIQCEAGIGSANGPADVIVTTIGGEDTESLAYAYVNVPNVTGLANADGPVTGGPQVGGTTLIISGTDLDDVSAITVGANPCTGITGNTAIEVSCTLPAGTPGDQTVSVTTPGGTNTSYTYTYFATPTITSVSPDAGPLAGGTPVTITGTYLDNTASIKIGGSDCTGVSGNSSTEVTCTLPTGSAGAQNIVLVNQGGTVTKTGGYKYVEAPQISSVTPDSGPVDGTGVVTINGTYLSDPVSIFIGGVECVNDPAENTATKIKCLAGLGTPQGVEDVTVTTLGGPDTETGAYSFVYPPTVSGLADANGPVTGGPQLGGTSLIITGTDLDDVSAITVGGNPCTGITGNTAIEVSCTLPAGTPGDQTISITTPGGTNTNYTYTYIAGPTIDEIAPVAGPLAGGQPITITGTNLDGANLGSITVGGDPCTDISVNSSTEVVCSVPAGSAGAQNVVLTNPGGTVTKLGGYTYAGAPTITTVSPGTGPVTGGTVLTVNGTNLLATSSVLAGTNACTNVTVVSAVKLTCTLPSGTIGKVDVEVTTPSGSTSASEAFEYERTPIIDAISPLAGPLAGGGTLTITGQDLDGATAVTIGGINCPLLPDGTSTEVTCTIPAGSAGAQDVKVTSPLGTYTLPEAYTYGAVPTIASLSATSGPVAGGGALTVTGTNLTGTTRIAINGVTCGSLRNVTSTTATCTIPAGTAGLQNVTITTPIDTATSTDAYTYIAAPTITSLSTTTGPAAGGGTTTITGTNLTGATTITIDGVSCGTLTGVTPTTATCAIPAGTAGAKNVVIR
jgi:hypothetical protein